MGLQLATGRADLDSAINHCRGARGVPVAGHSSARSPTNQLAGTPIQIEAVALDWKWMFIYPTQGVATVNRLVIPAGQPVHLRLTSATVMQSFLVPKLAGQIYAMAGMQTQLNLQADAPGRFWGENTQFNRYAFSGPEIRGGCVAARRFPRVGWQKRTPNPTGWTRRNTRCCRDALCSRCRCYLER